MVGFNERYFFSIFVAPQYIGKVSNIHGIWTTNSPKKTTWPTIYGCKMVQTNDLNSKFMSIPLKTLWHITCLPKHWLPIWGMGFCKKTKLFIDTQRRLIVLKDPQPKAKQLQSIRGPLGLESGPRVPQKTVDLSSHTSCLGASIPRQKAVVCWSPE